MAPGLKQLFKRQVEEEADEGGEEEGSETTTLATKYFGKHLHKVKITTPTTTLETEGKNIRSLSYDAQLNERLMNYPEYYRTR